MKLLRPILWGVAVLAVLLLVVVLLAFNSSVQTWATRRALSGQPGLKAAVGKVSAGMKVIELTDIHVEKPGLSLQLPSLTMEVSLVSAAGKNIEVKRLEAKGWKVDLWVPTVEERAALATSSADKGVAKTEATPEAGAAPFSFDGLFSKLVLPVDFSLDEVDVQGDVTLRAVAGLPKAHATLHLAGGKLRAGGEGRFDATTQLVVDDPGAPVTRVEIKSVVLAQMETSRTFRRISVVTDINAIGAKFPQGAKLHSEVVLNGGAQGENYLVALQTPIENALKDLFNLDVAYAPASGSFTGKWKADISNADVAPFTLGLKLPTFSATGEGTFETDRFFKSIHTTGRVDSSIDQLNVVMPELAALGRLRAQLDFDLSKKGESLRVERFSAGLSGSKPIASVQALQTFEYDLPARALKVTDASSELLRLTLHGLPLAWAQPFLKGLTISGDDVRGEFFASARNGGFSVRPAAPITIEKLNVTQEGRPLLKAVDIVVKMGADSTPQGWQADVSEISIQSGSDRLLTANLKAGQPRDGTAAVKAAGRVEIALPSVLAQPVATPYRGLLKAGTLRGDFTANFDGTKQFSGGLELLDLASDKVEKLPRLQLSLRADVLPDGQIQAQVPFVLDAAGRKSDIQLSAKLKTSPSLAIEADVVSTVIYLQDLQSLQALAAAIGQDPKSTATAKSNSMPQKPAAQGAPVADKVPFWSGCTGQLKVALKEIVYSPDVKIANVGGILRIEAGAIDLQNFKAVFGAESDAVLNGKMTFDPKAGDPYAFSGEAKVNGFDPSPFLRAANPQREPTIEGKFDVNSKLSGTAPNAALLATKVKADLLLTSRGGIFRGLALPKSISDRLQGKSGGLLSSITGSAVSLLGGSNKQANAAAALAELVPLLAAIPFDQLNVQLSHDASASLTRIQDFTLISPTVRLTGSGSILQQEGVSIYKQPLTAQLEMGAHGRIAELLGKANMLEGQPDALGYSPLFTPIKLDGTLSEIGTEALGNLLVQRVLSTSAGPLGNLFGK
jgi:hypothetical protein